jgi:hypothetical protein
LSVVRLTKNRRQPFVAAATQLTENSLAQITSRHLLYEPRAMNQRWFKRRKPMRCYGPWKNADLTERLIALRKAPDKHSFGKIAQLLSQEFNLDITRNAVLGRARRLRLPRVPVKPHRPYRPPSLDAPPNFSVELADYRMLVSFERIGGRSQKDRRLSEGPPSLALEPRRTQKRKCSTLVSRAPAKPEIPGAGIS